MEYRLNKNTYKIHLLARLPFLLIVIGVFITYQIFLRELIFDGNDSLSYLIQNIILVVLIIILLGIFIFTFINPYLLYKYARLYINDEYIEYHTGKVFYSTHFVPITKVQQVKINRGPIQRGYKASSITIKTAFDSLDTASIDTSVCEELKTVILKRIDGKNHEN